MFVYVCIDGLMQLFFLCVCACTCLCLCVYVFVCMCVGQIEKVLQQGDISDAAEPYLHPRDLTADRKAYDKCKHNSAYFCHQLGQYRMPFAWTAISVLEIIAGNQVLYMQIHIVCTCTCT